MFRRTPSRPRPLAFVVLILISALALWHLNGSGRTGSDQQAAQLVRDGTWHQMLPPWVAGVTPQIEPVQSVTCTGQGSGQNGVLQFLSNLVTSGGTNSIHGNHPAFSWYACTGTSTTGDTLYWCVDFPPQGSSWQPHVEQEADDNACHN